MRAESLPSSIPRRRERIERAYNAVGFCRVWCDSCWFRQSCWRFGISIWLLLELEVSQNVFCLPSPKCCPSCSGEPTSPRGRHCSSRRNLEQLEQRSKRCEMYMLAPIGFGTFGGRITSLPPRKASEGSQDLLDVSAGWPTVHPTLLASMFHHFYEFIPTPVFLDYSWPHHWCYNIWRLCSSSQLFTSPRDLISPASSHLP